MLFLMVMYPFSLITLRKGFDNYFPLFQLKSVMPVMQLGWESFLFLHGTG